MTQLPFMSIPVTDFLAETGAFDAEEFGAYARLLCHMWVHGAELPNDDETLRKCARLSKGKWKRIKPKIWPFLVETGEPFGSKITQRRLHDEYERASQKRNAAALNGAKGGRATSLKTNRSSLADAVGSLPAASRDRRSSAAGNPAASAPPPIPIPNHPSSSAEGAARAEAERSGDQQDGLSGTGAEAASASEPNSEAHPLISSLDRRAARRNGGSQS